jgi:hypothetical protein
MGKLYSTSNTLDRFKENFNQTAILRKSLTLFMKNDGSSNDKEFIFSKKNQTFTKSNLFSNLKTNSFIDLSLELINDFFKHSIYINNPDILNSVCIPPIYDNYENENEFISTQIGFLYNEKFKGKEEEDVKKILDTLSKFKDFKFPKKIGRTKTLDNEKFRTNSFFSSNRDSSLSHDINKDHPKHQRGITPFIKSISKKYARKKQMSKNKLINIDSNSLSSSIINKKRSISIPKSSSLFKSIMTNRKKNSIDKIDYLSIEPIKEYSNPFVRVRKNTLSKGSLGNINIKITRTLSSNKNQERKKINKEKTKALSGFNFQKFKKSFSKITQNAEIKNSMNNLHKRESSNIKLSYDQTKLQQILEKSRNSKMKNIFSTRSKNKKGNTNCPNDKESNTIESKDQIRMKNYFENRVSSKTHMDSRKIFKHIHTLSLRDIKKTTINLNKKLSSEIKIKKSKTERITIDNKIDTQNIKQKYKTQKITFGKNKDNEELKKKFISIDIRKLIEEEEYENEELNILETKLNSDEVLNDKSKLENNNLNIPKLINDKELNLQKKYSEKISCLTSSQREKNLLLTTRYILYVK